MPAPKKNQYYLLRSKNGRNRVYQTPDALLDACYDYFNTVIANPWYKKDWVGKNAEEVERPATAPFTLTGLYVFIGIDRNTWKLYKEREDFIPVTTHVEDVIYTQKFEGAAVGAFNANIIARDLGLADKKEIEANHDITFEIE